MKFGQRQRNGKDKSEYEKCESNSHVIEEDFWPKRSVVVVILIKSHDFPNLEDTIFHGYLVLVKDVAALEVP